MRYANRGRIRRFGSAFAPVLLLAAALPLMAPTCQPTTPGVKTFAKGSIVIPMDRCYQGDGGTPTGAPPSSWTVTSTSVSEALLCLMTQ